MSSPEEVAKNRMGRNPAIVMLCMGSFGMLHALVAIGLALYEILLTPRLSEAVAVLCVAVALLLFWVVLIDTAFKLKNDFSTHHVLARRLSICAGIILFPVLTIPALFALWQIKQRNRQLQKGNPNDSQ